MSAASSSFVAAGAYTGCLIRYLSGRFFAPAPVAPTVCGRLCAGACPVLCSGPSFEKPRVCWCMPCATASACFFASTSALFASWPLSFRCHATSERCARANLSPSWALKDSDVCNRCLEWMPRVCYCLDERAVPRVAGLVSILELCASAVAVREVDPTDAVAVLRLTRPVRFRLVVKNLSFAKSGWPKVSSSLCLLYIPTLV